MLLVRWLFAALSIPALLLGGLFLGLIVSGLATHACPPDELISSWCQASWYKWFEAILLAATAAIVGAATVAISTFLAPSSKATVGYLALAAGTMCLLPLILFGGLFLIPALLTALLSGSLVILRLARTNAA